MSFWSVFFWFLDVGFGCFEFWLLAVGFGCCEFWLLTVGFGCCEFWLLAVGSGCCEFWLLTILRNETTIGLGAVLFLVFLHRVIGKCILNF